MSPNGQSVKFNNFVATFFATPSSCEMKRVAYISIWFYKQIYEAVFDRAQGVVLSE